MWCNKYVQFAINDFAIQNSVEYIVHASSEVVHIKDSC